MSDDHQAKIWRFKGYLAAERRTQVSDLSSAFGLNMGLKASSDASHSFAVASTKALCNKLQRLQRFRGTIHDERCSAIHKVVNNSTVEHRSDVRATACTTSGSGREESKKAELRSKKQGACRDPRACGRVAACSTVTKVHS